MTKVLCRAAYTMVPSAPRVHAYEESKMTLRLRQIALILNHMCGAAVLFEVEVRARENQKVRVRAQRRGLRSLRAQLLARQPLQLLGGPFRRVKQTASPCFVNSDTQLGAHTADSGRGRHRARSPGGFPAAHAMEAQARSSYRLAGGSRSRRQQGQQFDTTVHGIIAASISRSISDQSEKCQ